MDEKLLHYFKIPQERRILLEENHQLCTAVYLDFYKVASDNESIR